MKARPSDVAAAHLQALLAALREDKARQLAALKEHQRRHYPDDAVMRRLRFYLPPPAPSATRARRKGRKR